MKIRQYSIMNLYICLLLLFPLSTLFQSLSFFNWINKFLLILIFVLQIKMQFHDFKIKRKWIGVLFLLILVHCYSLTQTVFPLYNSNMLYYFGFWILFAIFVTENSKDIYISLSMCARYGFQLIKIWTLIVGISIFLPSSYVVNDVWGSGRYFVSITGNSFRIATSALMILTLVCILFLLRKEKKLLLYTIVPLFCFYMCGSRNYLAIGLLILLVFWFIYCKNRTMFYFSLLPLASILLIILLNSSAVTKFAATAYNSNSYYDYWGTITNGRTVFWAIDLENFLKEPFLNRMLGCGINFEYVVTEKYYTSAHYAHNDFINILLNFGYVGIGLYIYSIYLLLKKVLLKEAKIPIFVFLLIFFVWFINAMFNMFYTYTCCMISYPLLLMCVNNYYGVKKIK